MNPLMVESYLNERYDFRYNVVTNRILFKGKEDHKYIIVNDKVTNSIWRELAINDIKCSHTDLRKILESNFSDAFCPFDQYFNQLPKWVESDKDYIDELSNTVITTNQTIWRKFFKKWIVAMVACIIDENIANHTAIILSGKQGVGKTRWLNNLVPGELHPYSYCGFLNLNNKDSDLQLSECFFINLDELANMSKSSLDKLKIMITKDRIRRRRAYGYNIENYTRRASFCGSVNNSQFLLDTTGNRRFLCFEIEEIDLDANINLDNVYSQAMALFHSGFRYWFNQEEIEDVNSTNKQFERTSLEEEVLLTHFMPCAKDDSSEILMTSELALELSRLGPIRVNNSSIRSLGAALQKHGFARFKHKGRYKYALQRKQSHEIFNLNDKQKMKAV